MILASFASDQAFFDVSTVSPVSSQPTEMVKNPLGHHIWTVLTLDTDVLKLFCPIVESLPAQGLHKTRIRPGSEGDGRPIAHLGWRHINTLGIGSSGHQKAYDCELKKDGFAAAGGSYGAFRTMLRVYGMKPTADNLRAVG